MSTIPEERPGRNGYFAAIDAEQEKLAGALAAIRADRQAGRLTAREAADNWINAGEAHLAAIRELRRQYFGGDD